MPHSPLAAASTQSSRNITTSRSMLHAVLVGAIVGISVMGPCVGVADGDGEGETEGIFVGICVGGADGDREGEAEGRFVDVIEGCVDGEPVGDAVVVVS